MRNKLVWNNSRLAGLPEAAQVNRTFKKAQKASNNNFANPENLFENE